MSFQRADGLMSAESTADYVDAAPKTLAQWRYLGIGPAFTKRCGRIYYFKHDVDAWMAARSGMLSTSHAKARTAILRKRRVERLSASLPPDDAPS